jgi:flagellar motor switch protein FliN/FliY
MVNSLNASETGLEHRDHHRARQELAQQWNRTTPVMSQLGAVQVEISVLLGRSKLPIHQFLRMGRGAVIPLDAAEHDEVWILANNHPIARGEIVIQGDRVAVSITDAADVPDYFAA